MSKSLTRRQLLSISIGSGISAAIIRNNPYGDEEKKLPARKIDKEKRQAIILNLSPGLDSATHYGAGSVMGGTMGALVESVPNDPKITRRQAIVGLSAATAVVGGGLRYFSAMEAERRALQNIHVDLTNAGYHVTTVSNGKELYAALKAARKNRANSANTLLFMSAHGGDTNAGPIIALPDGDLQLNVLSKQLSEIPGNVLLAMNSCRAAASYLDEHLKAPGNRVAFMANSGNREKKAHLSLPFFEVIRQGINRNAENIVEGSLKINGELKQKTPLFSRITKKIMHSEFTHFGHYEFKL